MSNSQILLRFIIIYGSQGCPFLSFQNRRYYKNRSRLSHGIELIRASLSVYPPSVENLKGSPSIPLPLGGGGARYGYV